jgi:hypothetical protein
MAEALLLTTPLTTPASSTTSYHVVRLYLDMEQQWILLAVRGTRGELVEARRDGAAAVTLLRTFNKANGSVKSLERRAIEWLQTQPEGADLAGTITGTPD